MLFSWKNLKIFLRRKRFALHRQNGFTVAKFYHISPENCKHTYAKMRTETSLPAKSIAKEMLVDLHRRPRGAIVVQPLGVLHGKANAAVRSGLAQAASTAHTVSSAIKTGKAIAGAAKGASVGGPYGAVAGALWEARGHIGKIVAAVLVLLMLPVLFIHGTEDAFVPVSMSSELYEAAAGPRELLLVEGSGHVQAQDKNPELYYGTVFRFLETYGMD